MKFNRRPVIKGDSIEQPEISEVKNSLSLFRASLEDAVRYGGDITRAALSKMVLVGDRKNIVVDTKTHMLMPGMCPAIPGWHTDGAPRPNKNPSLIEQEKLDDRYNRYHLLVTGEGCMTRFVEQRDFTLSLEKFDGTSNLYAEMSYRMNQRFLELSPFEIEPCTIYTWDWWEVHTAIIAQKREWRYLIRVTETDFVEPVTDLRECLRVQQNVYTPTEFGW